MMAYMLGVIIFLAIYGTLYIGIMEFGLFETEYSLGQYGIVHLIYRKSRNEIVENYQTYYQRVFYKKKWYQRYQYEQLPDKYHFDSDETRELWEKIQKN